jgi:hypothetical protein
MLASWRCVIRVSHFHLPPLPVIVFFVLATSIRLPQNPHQDLNNSVFFAKNAALREYWKYTIFELIQHLAISAEENTVITAASKYKYPDNVFQFLPSIDYLSRLKSLPPSPNLW